MSMGGKGGGQIFNPNSQQQQGGFYNQPGLMGFPDQGYQQPMQPMQPMGAGQPPTTYGGSMIRDPNYGGGYGGPPGFNPDGSPVMSAGGNRPVTSTAGIDRMQDWARSNPNSPFLPNDRPNPFYSGPPVGQFGGRGGSSPGFNPDGSPIGTGGQGRPVISTAGIDRMQEWGRSNSNSPFLPNDGPNPFYSGPPVGRFGGRGGYGGSPGFNPDGSPIGTGGQGRPVMGASLPPEYLNNREQEWLQEWGRSNSNSPFLPNDRPNPFYSGPPGGQFGGRGGSSPMPTPLPLEPTPQIQPAVQAPQPNFVPFVGADGGPVQVARPPVPPRVPVRRAPVQPTPQMAPTSQIMSSQAEQQAAMDRYMARRRGR